MIYFPKKINKSGEKQHNSTGGDIFGGLIGDKGLNTNVSVDIPMQTVIIAVVGIVAAVGLSVLVARTIKKSV